VGVDGDVIVGGLVDDNTVKIWSLSSGESLQTLGGHSSGVWLLMLMLSQAAIILELRSNG